MACGWWDESWDNRTTKFREPATRWNGTGLERCHVVPRYMGGSDEPSNLVLMCGACHAAQPDSSDPEDTYSFMRARTLLSGLHTGHSGG